MDITLDYAAPDADLREYLSVFYEFRAPLPKFEDTERADFAQIRFMLTGKGTYYFPDGHEQPSAEVTIVGPTTGNTRIRTEGPVHIFGAGLLPAGWGAFVGFEASTMVNRAVDAAQVFGSSVLEALRDLRLAEGLEAKVAIGNHLMRAVARQMEESPLSFTRSVDEWLESALSPNVQDLVDRIGLSRRQVERQCKRLYGVPPKLLARKYRAIRAATTLARGEAVVADLIGDNFYDQSHFIREIKQFTGLTPKKFSEDLPVLAKLTVKPEALMGKVDPIVFQS